jgi:hypothetical protein
MHATFQVPAGMVAPAEPSATKMKKLYGFTTTFGAGLLASSCALTFWI